MDFKKFGGKKFGEEKVWLIRQFELLSARTFFLIPLKHAFSPASLHSSYRCELLETPLSFGALSIMHAREVSIMSSAWVSSSRAQFFCMLILYECVLILRVQVLILHTCLLIPHMLKFVLCLFHVCLFRTCLSRAYLFCAFFYHACFYRACLFCACLFRVCIFHACAAHSTCAYSLRAFSGRAFSTCAYSLYTCKYVSFFFVSVFIIYMWDFSPLACSSAKVENCWRTDRPTFGIIEAPCQSLK